MRKLIIGMCVGILTFITCFTLFYGKFELFKFPFISEVWGTAGDWVMIVVTIVTAFFLVKTFNEQKSLNSLIFKQHKSSIRPFFNFISTDNNNMKIKLFNAHAFQIKIAKRQDLFSAPVIEQLTEGEILPYVILVPEESKSMMILTGRDTDTSVPITDNNRIFISFLDEDQNIYEQHIYYEAYYSNFHLSEPKMIE